jgi:iron complex outermembrane receptor protein
LGRSLQGLWDTGPVNLVWLTGYEWYDRKIDDEGDATPVASYPAVYEDSAWQLSQELRAEGEGERYRWFVGGFFLYEDLDASNLFPTLASRRIEQTWDQKLTSAAGYASGRYWLLDEVYLDAGIRYNYEHKEFTLASKVNALDGGEFDPIPEETLVATWTAPTGEAVLGWEPGGDWLYDARLDHLNLYVKYGRGFKGGHFNAGLTIQSSAGQKQRIDPVDPEFIHALEAGFKSRWLQNRLVLNLALFRYWYEDLQVFDFTNEVGELPIQKLLNSDANVLGAELEIQARPLPGLLLQFGGGWLDSEFVDFQVAKATDQPRGIGTLVEFDYSGNPLISAPEWNASGVVEYQIPLGRWGSLVPQYTISYRSKVYLDPQMLDPISQDPILLQNARLAYRTPNGRYEAALWVENFMNERYKIDAFDLSLGQNAILEVWNDPRTFGVTFSAYF